jgi:hypothetical protein
MKKFVLTVLAIAVAASPAFAQIGDISAYADIAGLSCSIADNQGFAFIDVFVLHKHATSGGTASQWTMTLTGGATLQYVSTTEAPGMLRLGDANVDCSIAYGGCVLGDFLIATVRWIGFGTSPPCSRVTFTPAPTTPIPGQVAAVDCAVPSGNLVVPATGQAIINENGGCLCNVPVTESTWGGIKALYR